jgi:hypothetical protein
MHDSNVVLRLKIIECDGQYGSEFIIILAHITHILDILSSLATEKTYANTHIPMHTTESSAIEGSAARSVDMTYTLWDHVEEV